MQFNFSDNQEVTDLSKVPSQFQGLYSEKEGSDGFSLRTDDPAVKGAIEAISGLNTALTAARSDAASNKGKAVDLSALSDYGTNVNEIATGFRSKVQELEEKLANTDEVKLDLNKVREEMGKAHAKDIQRSGERIKALESQLYSLLVENAATSAIAEAKGSPELLMPFVRSQVKVVEHDGQMEVFVVDESSSQRFSGVTGQPMTVTELISEMKNNAKYGRLFDSELPVGGGALPNTKPGRLATQKGERTSIEKIAAGLQKKAS